MKTQVSGYRRACWGGLLCWVATAALFSALAAGKNTVVSDQQLAAERELLQEWLQGTNNTPPMQASLREMLDLNARGVTIDAFRQAHHLPAQATSSSQSAASAAGDAIFGGGHKLESPPLKPQAFAEGAHEGLSDDRSLIRQFTPPTPASTSAKGHIDGVQNIQEFPPSSLVRPRATSIGASDIGKEVPMQKQFTPANQNSSKGVSGMQSALTEGERDRQRMQSQVTDIAVEQHMKDPFVGRMGSPLTPAKQAQPADRASDVPYNPSLLDHRGPDGIDNLTPMTPNNTAPIQTLHTPPPTRPAIDVVVTRTNTSQLIMVDAFCPKHGKYGGLIHPGEKLECPKCKAATTSKPITQVTVHIPRPGYSATSKTNNNQVINYGPNFIR